jgi:hypothetical protein
MKEALNTLINSLEAVTVEEVDAEIADIDRQIAAATEMLMKRRDALLGARRLILLRTEGAVQRKPRRTRSDKGKRRGTTEEPAKPEPVNLSVLERVVRHLTYTPCRVTSLCKALAEPEDVIRGCLAANKTMFSKDDAGNYYLVKKS